MPLIRSGWSRARETFQEEEAEKIVVGHDPEEVSGKWRDLEGEKCGGVAKTAEKIVVSLPLRGSDLNIEGSHLKACSQNLCKFFDRKYRWNDNIRNVCRFLKSRVRPFESSHASSDFFLNFEP